MPLDAERARRWSELVAGGRLRLVLDEMEQVWPGATRHPRHVPEDYDHLRRLIGHMNYLVGRFDLALRFIEGNSPLDNKRRREIEADRRVLANVVSVFEQPGHVTTVVGSRTLEKAGIRVSFVARSDRIDVQWCLESLTRMRHKLRSWMQVSLDRVEVEVYAARDLFRRRVEEEGVPMLPDHVQGLTAAESGRLLVELTGTVFDDPFNVYVRLRHELTHLAVRELRGDGPAPPFWLDEGLAIDTSQALAGSMQALWKRSGGAPRLRFDELAYGWPTNPGLRRLALAQSAMAVARLRTETGVGYGGLARSIREGTADRWTDHPIVKAIEEGRE